MDFILRNLGLLVCLGMVVWAGFEATLPAKEKTKALWVYFWIVAPLAAFAAWHDFRQFGPATSTLLWGAIALFCALYPVWLLRRRRSDSR